MKTLNTNECVSKAGRHRLYSNEQRKDRNRQAQAAFRDRRSKYTKDLEAAVLKFEEKIKTLEETNSRTTERAQLAEDRCTQLNLEVTSLQKLLQITLADNQRLLQAQTTMNREASPLSTNYSSTTSEIVSSSPGASDFLISSLNEMRARTTSAVDQQQDFHPVQLSTIQEQHFDNGLFDTKDINTWLEMNQSITGESTKIIVL